MATIKSGASSDQLTIDPTSKAARVILYDSLGRELSIESEATFSASGTFTPPATPTDMVTIYGSASKLVKVISFFIATTNTAAGSQQFNLIKRSAVNTTGTFVAATAVPIDSIDAATVIVGHYTANPGGLGAAVGTLSTRRVASPVAIPATFAGVKEDAGIDMLGLFVNSNLSKMITLRGISQGLCLNFNGVALVAGQTHAYTVVWMEE